ncbi:MAG: YdcF family protein [Roseburia sp.]|nr:YdcF family protein [Roseburia sp.]
MDRLHAVLTVVSAVFFLWFAAPFIGRGILNSGNLTGILVSGLLLYYGIRYKRVHAWLSHVRQSRGGRVVLVCLVVLCACAFVTALAETVGIVRAAANRPPENVTAVVLGCSVKGERPSRILEERLKAAYDYLEENPEAVCVLSGGQGPGEDISEAECMYRYLTEKGIAPERLLKEDASTTTEENLKYSMALLKEQGIEGEITIVTSEFHEYRANKVAERLGITSYSTPSHTFFLYLPTYYVRELYGILYYMIR